MSAPTTKKLRKRVIPPAGKKLSTAKARELVNKQFSKAFAKLSK
jgi:hypothetical protein